MQCIKCKKQIPDGSAFCNFCGKDQNPKPKRRAHKRAQGSGTIRKDARNRTKPWIAISPASRYGRSRIYLGAYATYKEAQDAIEKYTRESHPELHGATLGDVYRLWSAAHFRNVSQSAVSLYSAMWKRFTPIEAIKMEDAKTVHFQMIVDTATSKSAAETIKALASMLCRYAMQNDLISKNYAEFVKPPKFEKKEKRIFKSSEIKVLWEHADDARVRPILFMIYTGLRIGELFAITKEHLHLDDGYIICGEKTDAGRDRIVPLPPAVPELADWLEEWARMHPTGSLMGRSVQNYRDKQFYTVLEELGIQQPAERTLTPHSCRHTFASICAESGMKPDQLQKIIGHANFSTTADVYIHKDLDSLKAAMSRIQK